MAAPSEDAPMPIDAKSASHGTCRAQAQGEKPNTVNGAKQTRALLFEFVV
jgi:hypothetical protein